MRVLPQALAARWRKPQPGRAGRTTPQWMAAWLLVVAGLSFQRMMRLELRASRALKAGLCVTFWPAGSGKMRGTMWKSSLPLGGGNALEVAEASSLQAEKIPGAGP